MAEGKRVMCWSGFPASRSKLQAATTAVAAAYFSLSFAVPSAVLAHDGVVHKNEAEAQQHLLESANTPGFPDVKGGDFSLIDQFGRTRTSQDPDGNHQLLFFGYVNCKAICSVALPRMGEAVDILQGEGISITPVLVTVDPERDTVEAMLAKASDIHPNLIGLTGGEQELAAAYAAFGIENKMVYEHPTEGPIFAHGTYIYLLGPDGDFKSLFPPILSSDRIAELTADYVNGLRF